MCCIQSNVDLEECYIFSIKTSTIKETVNTLASLLKKKVRRTKAVNDVVENTIKNCVQIYEEIEKLKKVISLNAFSSLDVKKILENAYKNLKSLRDIEQFTSVLLFVDNILQNYLLIANLYFQSHENLQKKSKELEDLQAKYNKFVQEFEEKVKDMDINNTTKNEENLEFKLTSLTVPFASKCSKWLIIDKYQCFKQPTSLKLLNENWELIGNYIYLSSKGDEETLEKALEIIPNIDFLEYFQCIGTSDNIMKERRIGELFLQIPKESFDIMIQPHNYLDQEMMSNALHGSAFDQFKLGKYLFNHKFWKESKFWFKRSMDYKSIKWIKEIEEIENKINF